MDFYSDLMDRINAGSHFALRSGVTVTKLQGREAEGVLEVGHDQYNPMGIVHGGALVTLADTVAGCAAFTCGRVCVTLDCSFQFLASTSGSRITCRATPRKLGRTILVYDTLLTDEDGRAVASGTFTFFAKETPVEEASFR